MQYNAYGRHLTAEEIAKGEHRAFVGGMWDEIGLHQFNYILSQGLKPEMKMIDVGCGCLRGGVHFVRYLNSGNYYGLDVNESLLCAGYDCELKHAGLQHKMPPHNLVCSDVFDFARLNTHFDVALAQSLFTHLTFNHIRLCLIELCRCMKPGGRFFASYFNCPTHHPIEQKLIHEPGEMPSYCATDSFHYFFDDMTYLVRRLPWKVKDLGDWGHPRAQSMLLFERTA